MVGFHKSVHISIDRSKHRRLDFKIKVPAFLHLTVWGVEPIVTHQTSWLESTGVYGVRQNQAGGSSGCKRASCPVVGCWAKQPQVLTSNDAVKLAIKKEMLLIFACIEQSKKGTEELRRSQQV